MRRKRTVPIPQHIEMSGSPTYNDVNGRQILRLEDNPTLQLLTPRSLAKNMAELDALRCRVVELEQQLAHHQIEDLAPSKVEKKLPPLADAIMNTNPGLTSSPNCVKSTGDLKTVPSCDGGSTLSDRIATAPAATSRSVIVAASRDKPGNSNRGSCFTEAESITTGVLDSGQVATSTPMASCGTDNLTNGSFVRPRDRQCSSFVVPSRHGDTKIIIGQGDMATFATSQRNRLYQILKRLSALTTIAEDELELLKKLVDAEFGDVIKFLMEIETEASVPLICEKLSSLVKNGSPSKHRNLIRPKLPGPHPVWSIHYPLLKIAQNLEQLRGSRLESMDSSPNSSPSKKTDVIVLVSSGAYNPIHMLHIRAFYVARQYVESNYKFPVVGAFISPSHDTFVRVKNRRNPREMITKRHRLALIETAVGSSSWIEVDKWEITRRRVMDYHSTLTHVREMCESHFPQHRFHIMYVCGCNTVVKLSHSALRDEGFGCITVCRPAQTDMVIKHLGKTVAKTTTIVEDTGVLPCDLERATSFRVRQALANIDAHANMIEMMVGKPVFQYFVKHEIGSKVAGKVNWTDEDKQWRPEDLTYVEYTES